MDFLLIVSPYRQRVNFGLHFYELRETREWGKGGEIAPLLSPNFYITRHIAFEFQACSFYFIISKMKNGTKLTNFY